MNNIHKLLKILLIIYGTTYVFLLAFTSIPDTVLKDIIFVWFILFFNWLSLSVYKLIKNV
jgi:hypothetical protein